MSLPVQSGSPSGNEMNVREPRPAESTWRLKNPRRAARAASVLSFTCVAACACAANAGSVETPAWHEGRVRSVVTMQDLDVTVPLCGLRSRDATWSPDTRVAIVRSRVGKAPYDEAFVLAAGLDVHAGSEVRFDRAGCILQQPRKPAPS